MKIRYGLVLAIAIVIGVTGCASGGGGATDGENVGGSGTVLAQGERPRDTDNTRAAERALEAGDDTENEAEARIHYEQASASADDAVAEDPTNPFAQRLAAMAALALEDYEAAGRHFDRAAELRPLYQFEDRGVREGTWIDLYQRGAGLVQSGDYEGAAGIFENANAIYAERPEAMITLGQIYAQTREHDRALESLANAVAVIESAAIMEVDSATAVAWREQAANVPMLRAGVLADAGRFEEAVVTYREFSAADPENVEPVQSLATVLMQMGNEAEALEVYTGLLSRSGLSGEDYYTIGVGLYRGSDYEQAARAFSGAADVSPLDRDALEMWARSMQLDSSYADVPAVVERWIALDPNSQNAYLILAQASNLGGDLETTQQAIRQVEALEVSIEQLQIRRSDGGGVVSGSLTNKTLTQGASVTLRFTFYSEAGDPIGTVTESVTVAAEGMAEIFQIQFDSTEYVGGYGYEVTIG